MQRVVFISHANVVINPNIPVPDWGLSEKGKSRHHKFNENSTLQGVRSVYSSMEQKAIDGGKILANFLDLELIQIESLGENDRSSTGYLKEKEFQQTANQFFENPTISVRGWEKAIEAQKRIVDAVEKIIQSDQGTGDIAIVSHGGVGTLLMCHLLNKGISRSFDQPPNGGGNYFVFEKESRRLLEQWKDISA